MQFFYQLYSNYGRPYTAKDTHRSEVCFTINSILFKAFHSFSETIQGLFPFSEIHGLFKADLEFNAGTGILMQTRPKSHF